jgi:hypothetical protein
MAASRWVPWAWSNCDDACAPGSTATVTRIPDVYAPWVLPTALVLVVAAAAVALLTRRRPWLDRLIAGLATAVAGVVAIVLFGGPDAGSAAGPFVRPHVGWWLDLAAVGALVAAGIGTRPVPRPGDGPVRGADR